MSPEALELTPGKRVRYRPVRDGKGYLGSVESEPWILGGHTMVVNLRDMSEDYVIDYRGRTRVVAARVDGHVELIDTDEDAL